MNFKEALHFVNQPREAVFKLPLTRFLEDLEILWIIKKVNDNIYIEAKLSIDIIGSNTPSLEYRGDYPNFPTWVNAWWKWLKNNDLSDYE